MSFDNPLETEPWAIDQAFQFELWSDIDGVLALYYGAVETQSDHTAARITKLIGADGVLLLEYLEDVVAGTHPSEVLEDCEKIFGVP